jgi:hypothetical protein
VLYKTSFIDRPAATGSNIIWILTQGSNVDSQGKDRRDRELRESKSRRSAVKKSRETIGHGEGEGTIAQIPNQRRTWDRGRE